MDCYIHQIGSIYDKQTYTRLRGILQLKAIASRNYLEKMGVDFKNIGSPFILKIPEGDEWLYYYDDIHKNVVSLSDPRNRFIKTAIMSKDEQTYTCFDYNYIALAVSREVPIIPREQTKGLAVGEVQVLNQVDLRYVTGLIIPVSKEQLQNDTIAQMINYFAEFCSANNYPLDIYNYEGELLLEKKKNHYR